MYVRILPVCVQVGVCEYRYVYICASLIDLKLPQWARLAGLRASGSPREPQGAPGSLREPQGALGSPQEAQRSLREPQGA